MLEPALLHKEELLKKFAKVMYTHEYFLYSGWPNDYRMPNISDEGECRRYAVINKDGEVTGYIAYTIDPSLLSVSSFGLYSFTDGLNMTLAKDLSELMESLIKTYHRIEYQMVGGNPVEKSYDRFIKKYGGEKHVLHDYLRDNYGKVHDRVIYEIITDVPLV